MVDTEEWKPRQKNEKDSVTVYHMPKSIIISSQVTSNSSEQATFWLAGLRQNLDLPSPELHGGAEVWISARLMACWQLWVGFLLWNYLLQTLRSLVNFCLLWLWKLLALQGLTLTRREVAAWPSSCNAGQEHILDLVLKWIWVSSWQMLSVFMANTGAFHLPNLGPKVSISKMLTQSMCSIALWWPVHWSLRLLLLPLAGVGAACVREAGTTGSREKSGKYWSGPYFVRTVVCCCFSLLWKL